MRRIRAAGIDAFGGEVHTLELLAPRAPAPDELVISVRAAGVGNWDEIVRVGDWDVGRKPPLALGVEAAGVVAAVGEDVTIFAVGDGVLTHPLPLRHQGTWAQLLAVPAALVAPKPAAVPWRTAAPFPGRRPSRCRRGPPTRGPASRPRPRRGSGCSGTPPWASLLDWWSNQGLRAGDR